MGNPRLFRLAVGLLGVVVLGFSPCGADNVNSPTYDSSRLPRPQTCETLSQLAPALWDAVQNDQVSGLRQVLQQLNQPAPGGNTPYLNQVLQALFVALNEFAQDPPEAGNSDGLCNDSQSLPLEQTNRLCDLRRLLKIYVHEGTASESLHALDPLLAGVLAYMLGQEPAASTPHYEIARNLEVMCTGTGVCDAHDTFDLVQGVTSYLTPDKAQTTLQHIEALANDPLLTGLFATLAGGTADGGASPTAEAGFELIANELICATLGVNLTTATARQHYFDTFDTLLNGSNGNPGLYSLLPQTDAGAQLAGEIAVAAGDLKEMLDPSRQEPIFQPLQKVLTCAATSSPGASLCGKALRPGFTPMIYHLGFEAKVITLPELLHALDQLVAIDAKSEQPGLLMFVLHDIVGALNADPQAPDALTQLCHTVFATERPCDDGNGAYCAPLPLNYQPDGGASPQQGMCSNGLRASYAVPDPGCLSNVEAAIPEVQSLFNQGVTDEVLCVIDTMVYGCTGGAQPACQPPPPLVTDAGS